MMSTCVHSSRARTLELRQTTDKFHRKYYMQLARLLIRQGTGLFLFFKKKKKRKELSPLQVKKHATEWGSHAFEL